MAKGMIHTIAHMLGINTRWDYQRLDSDGRLFDVVKCKGCGEIESDNRSSQCKLAYIEMRIKSIFPEWVRIHIHYEFDDYMVKASKPNGDELLVAQGSITGQMFDMDFVDTRLLEIKEAIVNA